MKNYWTQPEGTYRKQFFPRKNRKKWFNHSYIFFNRIEKDYRILHKPFKTVVYVDNTLQLKRTPRNV